MIDGRGSHWLPVDQYIGGIEHAVLHLLYARFFHKAMRDLGVLPAGCGDEPFSRLLCQGMVIKDGAKMSKSRGNTVDPQEYVDSIGADATRMFMIFSAPSRAAARMVGLRRPRLRPLPGPAVEAGACGPPRGAGAARRSSFRTIPRPRRRLHEILRKADFDMQRMLLNNIVSAGMSMANLLADHPEDAALLREGFSILLRLLNPVVPHISQRLWEELGFAGLLADAVWPRADEQALASAVSRKMVVQVNGRKCGLIEVATDAPQDQVREAACALAAVQRRLGDSKMRKVIVVPGKIVNIVA